MKQLLLLFLIVFPSFEYAMQGNVRPLVAAARNREAKRPHAPIRIITIARLINGKWHETEHIKQPKEQKGPYLKHPHLEKNRRFKRDKPWTDRESRDLNNEHNE